MRILIFWMLFLKCVILANCDNANLTESVKHLSMLSRIINGISLQEALSGNSFRLRSYVSEFVGSDLRTSFLRFQSIDSSKMSDSLASVKASVQQIVRFDTSNMNKVQFGFQLLNEMNTNLTSVEGYPEVDHYQEIKELLHETFMKENPNENQLLDVNNIAPFLEAVKFVMSANLEQAKSLGKAVEMLSRIRSTKYLTAWYLTKYRNYTNSFGIYKQYPGLTKKMEKVMVIAHVMQKYSENFEKLVGVVGELDEMKKSVSTVVSIGSIQPVIKALGDQLGNVSEVVSEAMKPSDSEKLTRGLPNGVADLDAIFKDLDSEGLRNLISEGKDLNKLKTLLNPIRKFTEDVRRLETSWRPVNDKKSLDALSELSENLKKMSKGAQGLSTDANTLQNSIQSVQKCFNGLTNLSSTVDFRKFDEAYQFIIKAEPLATAVNAIFEEISTFKEVKGPFGGRDNFFSEVMAKFDDITNDVYDSIGTDEAKRIIGNVRNITGLDQFIKELDVIVTKFAPHKNASEFMIEGNKFYRGNDLYYESLQTNLTKTLKCLELSSDADQLNKIIEADNNVEILKSELNQVSGLNAYLASLKTAQNDIQKVFKGVQKKLRIRRNVNGTANMTEMSQKLGQGVEVLQKMSRVLSDKESVKKLAESASEVDFEIQKIPKMSGVWKKETKEELLQMIRELGDLEVTAGQVDVKDLMTMQTLFEAATKIKGSQIDTRLLLDPVSLALNTSTSPTVKSAVKDFQIVGNLDIDFTNTHLDLRAASGTLSILQNYFDRFFGIKRVKVSRLKPNPQPAVHAPNATQPSSPAWLIYVYILIALIVILLILVAIAYFVWRLYQKDDPLYWHRKYMKKKLDGQFTLYSRYLAFQEEAMFGDKDDKVTRKSLLCAVEKNKLELAEDYLKRGAYVNATRNTESCLHIAVGNTASPEMVELLIRNGADRNALNRQNVTPEGLIKLTIEHCEKMIATKIKEPKKPRLKIAAVLKKYEDEKKEVERKKKEQESLPKKLESLAKVKKVFEDLRDEHFERRVPHLLPVEKFQVFVAPNCDKGKFERSFPGNVTSDLTIATHVVVKTNKDGVLELDDDHLTNMHMIFDRMMLMKESWLKACMKRKANMRNDYKFRVKAISFKGKQYNTVLEAHESVHMRKVPILYDAQILYTNPEDKKVRSLLESLGATWLLKYPDLSEYNHATAHPYHFSDKQLIWAVFPTSDKKSSEDLSNFCQLSLEELMVVLLERKFSYDEKKEPRPPVLIVKEVKEDEKGDTTEDDDKKDD